jgi:hypothetical protein
VVNSAVTWRYKQCCVVSSILDATGGILGMNCCEPVTECYSLHLAYKPRSALWFGEGPNKRKSNTILNIGNTNYTPSRTSASISSPTSRSSFPVGPAIKSINLEAWKRMNYSSHMITWSEPIFLKSQRVDVNRNSTCRTFRVDHATAKFDVARTRTLYYHS